MNIQGLPQIETYPLHLIVLTLLCLDYTIVLSVPYRNNGYRIYSCYDLFSSLRCSWRHMKNPEKKKNPTTKNKNKQTKQPPHKTKTKTTIPPQIPGHFIELHLYRSFILTLALLSMIMILS